MRKIKPKERSKKYINKDVNVKKKVGSIKQKRSKKKNLLLIRRNFCSPLTKKPLQVRMGKGKGATDSWVSLAKKSNILFELSRQYNKTSNIKKYFDVASIKLPIKTRFVFNKTSFRRENKFIQKFNI